MAIRISAIHPAMAVTLISACDLGRPMLVDGPTLLSAVRPPCELKQPTLAAGTDTMGAYARIVGGATGDRVEGVEVGDFDGDGCADVAVVSMKGLLIYRGPLDRGVYGLEEADAVIHGPLVGWSADDGVAAEWQLPLSRAGDTNGDGVLDLWAGGFLLESPQPSTQDAEAHAAVTLAMGIPGAVTSDIDMTGDGVADLAFLADAPRVYTNGPFAGLVGDAEGPDDLSLQDSFVDEQVLEWTDDVSGNGVAELLISDGSRAHFYELQGLLGRHDLAPSEAAVVTTDFSVRSVGDITGDGRIDYVARNGQYLCDGTLFTPGHHAQPPGCVEWASGGSLSPLGDVDGDGLGDVLDVQRDAPSVVVLSEAGAYTLPMGGGTPARHAEDLTGDGASDVALAVVNVDCDPGCGAVMIVSIDELATSP